MRRAQEEAVIPIGLLSQSLESQRPPGLGLHKGLHTIAGSQVLSIYDVLDTSFTPLPGVHSTSSAKDLTKTSSASLRASEARHSIVVGWHHQFTQFTSYAKPSSRAPPSRLYSPSGPRGQRLVAVADASDVIGNSRPMQKPRGQCLVAVADSSDTVGNSPSYCPIKHLCPLRVAPMSLGSSSSAVSAPPSVTEKLSSRIQLIYTAYSPASPPRNTSPLVVVTDITDFGLYVVKA
ncbi:hypothetical protein DFH09DRAFT_1292375 [Mycena vulgaris]|nr:hypothetical protein DFH09DRAFT_1292375 [Mycena vulgaris]